MFYHYQSFLQNIIDPPSPKKMSSRYKGTYNERGGRPSGYMTTKEVERVKRLMENLQR